MKRIVLALVLFFCAGKLGVAQTPAELNSWLPKVDSWTLNEEIEVFDADNLFNRINGSAPLYLENNFREMTSMEYTKPGDYITIQAYRHATAEDAFGMYASERSSGMETLTIGGESQADDTHVYFFAGCMYVKVWCNKPDNKEALVKIATDFSRKIDPNAGYPAIVKMLPSESKIPYTETYITSNYIGHEFLKSVYTSLYQKGDQKFQVFVIDGKTTENAKETLLKYLTFTKQSKEIAEGELTISDRYNGEIPILWKGQYIIGLFAESGNILAEGSDLIKAIAAKL